jgi:hypothetical protein
LIKTIDFDKYADIFGFGEAEGKANAKINEMLDEIERLYSKEAMPHVWQIMVHSYGCEHCQASVPMWKELTRALSLRLKRYASAMIEIDGDVEITNSSAPIDEEAAINLLKEAGLSGIKILQKFDIRSIPFFLQNFTVEMPFKNKSITVKNLKSSNFYVVSVGELQPFGFLATAFDMPNSFIEWKYSSSKSR